MFISPLGRLSDPCQRGAKLLIMQPPNENYATADAYIKEIFHLCTIHSFYPDKSLD